MAEPVPVIVPMVEDKSGPLAPTVQKEEKPAAAKPIVARSAQASTRAPQSVSNPSGLTVVSFVKKDAYAAPDVTVGAPVAHNKFGKDIVTHLDKPGKHIKIKFADGEKMFIFPDAFKNGFLKLDSGV